MRLLRRAFVPQLSRYGYLPSQPNGLPVGFTSVGTGSDAVVGMTCSACHTRPITVDNIPYRVDGGPAIVDFQSFLGDLDSTVGTVLSSDSAFTDFATGVLGHAPTPGEAGALRQSVNGKSAASGRATQQVLRATRVLQKALLDWSR